MASFFVRTALYIAVVAFFGAGLVDCHTPHTCLSQDSCSERRLTKLEKRLTKLETLLDSEANEGKSESCEKLYYKGERHDGIYIIDLGLEGYLRVFCKFSHKPIQTIIQHNYPGRTAAKGTTNCGPGEPGGKIYNLKYGSATKNQLVKVMQGKRCKQFLKYECHGSVIFHQGHVWAYWADRDGNKMNYWAGGPHNGVGCACGKDKSCAGGAAQVCNCDKNDAVWRSDEGYITDKTRLPVSAVRICDTDLANEDGFFTLGPLVCVK